MAADRSVVRLACGDIDRMRSVLQLYADAFEEPEAYLHRQPDNGYLEGLLAREDFIQLACVEGGNVVGALSAYILPKFEQPRSEIYIYDLAVAEPYRRRGVATALIAALNPIAAAAGAWVIYVQAAKGDEAPIALYGKLGERADVLHFDIAPAALP